MAKLIFRLNGVGDDEAGEVRELFSTHNIEYYETDAGRFGISVAALWLADDSQQVRARQLLDEYQSARSARVRAELAAARAAGTHPNLYTRFRHEPLRFLLVVAAIGAILYLSLMPFLSLP